MTAPVNPATLALRLQGITKRFPGVTALDGIDLDVHRGEVHALLGENGAGKSTLIKIMSGVHVADQGDFIVGGDVVAVTRPNEASRLGITVVPQDILMVPEFSIGRNILLGGEGAFGASRPPERRRTAHRSGGPGQGRRQFRSGHQNLDAQHSRIFGWRRLRAPWFIRARSWSSMNRRRCCRNLMPNC